MINIIQIHINIIFLYYERNFNVVDVDLVLTSFDIAESRVIVDGVTSASVTLAGHVILGTVDRGSFRVTLYWSKDAVLDDSDVDSGKTRIYLLWRPFKCYVTAFFWKIDTHPPPRNANNVELYTFVTLFLRKVDTPNLHCIT